jgi:hypothetical protein
MDEWRRKMSSVWATLSIIDCSEHIKKKGQFSYLSWTWAWEMVKENYPDATYKILKDRSFEDGSMEVRVSVVIDSLEHTMWLPVLDFKNNAIQHPNAFDINTARMRCLVKCLAMHGLGHYIYAGESLPAPSPELKDKFEELVELVAKDDYWAMRKFVGDNQSHMDELFNMSEQGSKTKFKSAVRACYAKSNDQMKATIALLEDAVGSPEPQHTVTEIMGELEELERDFVLLGMNEILASQVNEKLHNGE